MTKKIRNIFKVSVGIPALNEEKTIGNILDSVLSQEQNGWSLSEVLVYSDGSIDGTVNEAKKRNCRVVKVTEFKERRGKTHRLNQMFKRFKGDVLVLLDADVKIADKKVITNLVDKFRDNNKVMLVGGDSRVFQPRTFFEKAIYTSYYVYFKSREQLCEGNNVFACTGACLALRRKFAREMKIPTDIFGDDLYIYLSCKKMGHEFRYVPKAKVYYKIASNLKDFLRQMFRSHPEAVNLVYKKHFGDLLDKEYYRPTSFYIKTVLEIFFKNPLGTTYMTILKLLTKPFYFYFAKKYKLSWFTAVSTKGKA